MKKRSGPKTSDSSKKIIRLLKRGISTSQIQKKGFSRATIQYYNWKLNRPEKFEAFKNKIQFYNKRRLEALSK